MQSMSKLFKSLADETRLRILLLLQEHDELCVCDLMHALDQPQSTVSRHLAYLKRAGWLQDRRGGVWMYYSMHPSRSAMHIELSRLLHNRCLQLPEYVADRERLAAYRHEKNCI